MELDAMLIINGVGYELSIEKCNLNFDTDSEAIKFDISGELGEEIS